MPTPAEIIENVFTTANPTTGSQPPAEIAWVMFANGTAFFTIPNESLTSAASFDDLEDAARAALSELGPVGVGSASADFNTARLDGWYPDESVWFVTFDHPAIATVVVEDKELVAGLHARALRQQDHDEQVIVLIRRFDGSKRAA